MRTNDSSRPVVSLMTQVVSDLAFLVQTEIKLARAELSEKVARITNSGIFMGIAAVLALVGLFILLLGVVRWLEVAGLPDRWGYLLVGGVSLAIAAALGMKAANNLKGSALVPARTMEQLRADYTVAKEHVS